MIASHKFRISKNQKIEIQSNITLFYGILCMLEKTMWVVANINITG